eukprot:3305101-Pyramimonas_sp.AAC.1
MNGSPHGHVDGKESHAKLLRRVELLLVYNLNGRVQHQRLAETHHRRHPPVPSSGGVIIRVDATGVNAD